MMKKAFLCLLVYILFGMVLHAQPEVVDDKYKKEALDFSLKVIEAYFEKDCKKVYSYFNAEIATLDGDGIFRKKDLVDKLCESVTNAVGSTRKSFKNYQADYITEIYTKPEYTKQYGKFKYDYYTPEDDDLLFVGFRMKSKAEDYIWDDMFIFMVKKIDGKWKIIAVSG